MTKKLTLIIEQDNDAEDPRSWENTGKMVCFHNRYKLGDEHDICESSFDGWGKMEEFLVREYDAWLILPLALFDHGSISMQVGTGYGWDSGQVGFIYATAKDLRRVLGLSSGEDIDLARARRLLEGEVETYDQYLQGDIYSYVVENEYGDHLDSCYGFYGREAAEEEGNAALQHYQGLEDDEDNMTLQEAINHARMRSQGTCDACGRAHVQLAVLDWLEELKEFREEGRTE